MPDDFNAPRIAPHDARHQSSGDCSAQPMCGEENATCSAIEDDRTSPSSPMMTAREPPVPMSSPRNFTFPKFISRAISGCGDNPAQLGKYMKVERLKPN